MGDPVGRAVSGSARRSDKREDRDLTMTGSGREDDTFVVAGHDESMRRGGHV
jgi:hypothetical protein